MNKIKILILFSALVLFFFLFFPLITPASENSTSVFQEANGFYEKGDFKKAIELYKELTDDGIKDGVLYYNLGNAFFKMDAIGKAILYYEKALVLSPRDREIKENLEYARSLTVDKQYDNHRGLIHLFLSGFDGFLSVNEITAVTFVLYILLFLSALLYIFIDNFQFRFYMKVGGVFLLTLFIIFSFFLSVRIYNLEYNPRAIIMTSEEGARSGPGENYTEVFSIHEGSLVYLKHMQRDWAQVSLPNGYTGWVKSDTLEEI